MNKFDYDELAKNEKTVHIHRRGMMSLVSCVISNNNSDLSTKPCCTFVVICSLYIAFNLSSTLFKLATAIF